jgi:hypothetical protein
MLGRDILSDCIVFTTFVDTTQGVKHVRQALYSLNYTPNQIILSLIDIFW